MDLQIRRAMEHGEFDNLPGAGKPIPGLGGTHDRTSGANGHMRGDLLHRRRSEG
ncbi:MAG: DnaJ family domain-containing protein [Nocardioidaceae bacterium]